MRLNVLLVALALLTLALSGCASSDDRQPASVDQYTTSPEKDAADDDVQGNEKARETSKDAKNMTEEPVDENVAPEVALEVGNLSAEAPADITFTIDASDDDGDELAWTLDADGDGTTDTEGAGADLPLNYTHSFTEAGNYTAVLVVSDGSAETTEELLITILEGGGPVRIQDDAGDALTDFTEIEWVEALHEDDVLQVTMKTAALQDPSTGGGYASYQFRISDLAYSCVTRYPIDTNPLAWDHQNSAYLEAGTCTMDTSASTVLITLTDAFLAGEGAQAPYDLATVTYGGTFALALSGDDTTVDDLAPDEGTVPVA